MTEFMNPEDEENKLWEEARGWAVAQILAKYHNELLEAQREHFKRLKAPIFDCGHACEYVKPYGWVPEAGCPIHDID